MFDFKLFSKCYSCKKRRFYIAKRSITLPIGPTATSQEHYCNKCFKPIQAKIRSQYDGHH